MMSRIEQLIDEIEEFVESCKPQPFSQSKIIVPKDELFELLTELRLKTPDEIKRYQKIIANKDKIINDAQAQAERMLEETTAYTNQLVEEHQIMLKAYERAEEVINAANAQAEATVNEANANAEEIRLNALQYTKDLVDNLENIVSGALAISQEHTHGLITGLSSSLQVLKENQEALSVQLSQPEASDVPPVYTTEEAAASAEPEEEELYESDDYEEDEVVDDDADDDEFDYDDID
jgi:E3 ubiquitin-protein ligase DOA10